MGSKGWKKTKLGAVVGINEKSISSNYPHKIIEYIDTSSVTNNRFDTLQEMNINEAPSRAKRIVRDGDTIISTVRPIQRHFGFIKKAKENTIASTGFAVLTPKKIHPEFLYYYISQDIITLYLNAIAETTTTTFPAFRPDTLKELEVEIPESIEDQIRIASILSALDDKIEINRQTNQTLEAIAQAIYKEWFVNFNFPGAPGEMQDSELGPIPNGWKIGELGEIVTNYDSKRIPLSSREREKRKGIYPYYGAASIMDYINDFIFDGIYLLMGEDGTVVTEDDRPVLQYVSGKFWVNNHAHVLQGRDGVSTEYIYLLLKNTNIKHIITGAVQPKINQANMNSLRIVCPDLSVLDKFQAIINPLFLRILNQEQENATLIKIRDNLLPKLMSSDEV